MLFILSFNVLKRFFLSFAQFRGSFYSLDFTDFRDTAPLRDGPLEQLWGGDFRAAGIVFRYQIPCMNFF